MGPKFWETNTEQSDRNTARTVAEISRCLFYIHGCRCVMK